MALASGTIQGVVGLEAGLGKRKYLPGVEIARTPEDKITAGLQEVRAYLVNGVFFLALTVSGCAPLFGKLGLNGERTSVLEIISVLGAAVFFILCLIVLFFGSKTPILRLSIQPVLVTGRVRSWRTPSLVLSVAAAIVLVGGFALVVTTSYFDFTQGGDPSSALRFLNVPQVLGGSFGVCAMMAAAMETLEWVQDIRRDQTVPNQQAEQEPQLPSWAQTL